ncbi:MAG: carbohydrate ABC transporter permease [Anaerolineae bacterium]
MTTTRFLPVWQRFLITVLVVGFALLFVMPLWWAIVWATWHTGEIFSFPPKFTPGPYLFDNLMRLQERLGIWRAFSNSVLVTLISMIGALFFCSIAGYGFAKYRFRLRNLFFYVLLATMAVPGQITAIPLFVLMVKLGWVDTYQGVIIPGLVPAFGVFLMRMSAEESIPDEFLEAARIDGANELRIFWQVALPNLLPHVAALSIFLFAGSWGSLFWPLIVLRSTEMFTLPVALSSILGAYEQPYDLLLAGSLLAIIPPLALFLSNQRYFMKSLVAGAFK